MLCALLFAACKYPWSFPVANMSAEGNSLDWIYFIVVWRGMSIHFTGIYSYLLLRILECRIYQLVGCTVIRAHCLSQKLLIYLDGFLNGLVGFIRSQFMCTRVLLSEDKLILFFSFSRLGGVTTSMFLLRVKSMYWAWYKRLTVFPLCDHEQVLLSWLCVSINLQASTLICIL